MNAIVKKQLPDLRSFVLVTISSTIFAALPLRPQEIGEAAISKKKERIHPNNGALAEWKIPRAAIDYPASYRITT